ncbi:MAG: glycosyltransferase [Patescibacteria group bacterium]|nr:glycosyltransferase [Patescibacteria group bacterium]MCL5224224.1 glycosyltransferase [Patescibacteria group bacterium]
MESKPEISIIIPTFNEAKYIEKTLKQITDNLTEFSYEIIVADSNSPDGTAAIAKQYTRVISHERGAGHMIAWNKNQGAAVSHGEYLMFIDADVFIPDPNQFFKTALDDFKRDPRIVAITGNVRIFKEEETFMDTLVFRGYVNPSNWLLNDIFHMGAAGGEFQMIRRRAFEAVHGYKEQLVAAEDHDMFIRLSKIGRTFFDRRLTVYETGRRERGMGWPRLLLSWWLNYYWMRFFKHAYDREWEPIR